MAVADLNGDERPDVVTANSYGNDDSIFLGAGDGALGEAHEIPAGTAPASVAIADLNGDNHPDIITTNGGIAEGDGEEISGSNDVSVALGRGDGTFADQARYPAGAVPMGIAVADVNGDGAPDLLTVDRHRSQLALLLGTGKGTFRPYRRIPISGLTLSRRLAAADLNGDGAIDVIVPDEGGSVWVLVGNGDGTFKRPVAYPTNGIEPVAVAVGDLNGDASPDLATANGYPAHDVSVLLGRGDGTFDPPKLYAAGYAPHSGTLTDLNGDGKVDLAAGNVGGKTVSLLLGRGDGTLAGNLEVPTGSAELNNTMVVSDMNGDGRPDLITTNYKPTSLVTVLLQSPD